MEANLVAIQNLTKREQLELDRLLSSYSVFQTTYYNDPAGFVLDCFRWEDGDGPTEYQLDFLNNFVMRKRTAVRTPHGAGKKIGRAHV